MRQFEAWRSQVQSSMNHGRGLASRLLGLLLLTVSLVPFAAAATAATAHAPESSLPAHQLVWQQWTVAEGLPQITVNDILQDRAGYLWVATQDGIARFDGVSFRTYTHAEHPGLGHGVVTSLGLDRDGALWMGSMAGVSRFVGGRIVPVEVQGGTGIVLGVRPHPDGGMWVAAEKGLFHARGRRATPVRLGDRPVSMTTVLQPADGPEIAIGPFHLVIDPRGKKRVVELGKRISPVFSATLARDGGLLLGTMHGVFRADREGRVRGEVIAKGREVQTLVEAPDGTLWIGTDRGLLRYRPDGVLEPVVVPGIDATAWVGRIFIDRERNLWFGTQLTGLHRAWADRFRRITARDGLVDGAVWSVYEAPDGEIWAGTPDGLYRGGLDGFREAIPGRELPHPNVTAILRDRRGGLWVGTYTRLVYRAPGATRLEPVPQVGAVGVFALLEDRNGDVLVGALDGLFRIPAGRIDRTTRIKLPGLGGGFGVTGIVHGLDGRLWVGNEGGVSLQDGDRWKLVAGSTNGRIRSATLTAFEDGVLASSIDGLFFVSRTRVRRIGRAEGLHQDAVHSVLVGGRDVWYQGPRGVGRIDAEALRALVRGERMRVDVDVFGDLGAPQMAQCNGGQQASGVLSQGRWLWCPDLKGLMVLDLTRAGERALAPRPWLQSMTTPKRRIDLAMPRTHGLELAPDERDLQIGYTGLHLRTAERLRFHARLVGYDSRWQALGTRRTAYYTNLPAGRYTFELFAVNGDGVRGPTQSLGFTVQPHWHETPLARAGAVLALLLLIAGAMRWRMHALNRRRLVLEARVRHRTGQLEAANRELETANRKLEAASVTDPLTGLHNRRYLLEHLPHELARLDRLHSPGHETEAVLTFMHLDLDNFKRINDTHGHYIGDQVLQIAATLLRENSRASDFVLRWGGEELLVIGRDTGRDDAHAWATRIVESFRHHRFDTDAGPLEVTCSVGHAVYPMLPGHRDRLGWEDVMNLADAATYLAKREGRDRCVGFELLRAALPADFIARVHTDADALEAEGWIRIRREKPRAGAGPQAEPAG